MTILSSGGAEAIMVWSMTGVGVEYSFAILHGCRNSSAWMK